MREAMGGAARPCEEVTNGGNYKIPHSHERGVPKSAQKGAELGPTLNSRRACPLPGAAAAAAACAAGAIRAGGSAPAAAAAAAAAAAPSWRRLMCGKQGPVGAAGGAAERSPPSPPLAGAPPMPLQQPCPSAAAHTGTGLTRCLAGRLRLGAHRPLAGASNAAARLAIAIGAVRVCQISLASPLPSCPAAPALGATPQHAEPSQPSHILALVAEPCRLSTCAMFPAGFKAIMFTHADAAPATWLMSAAARSGSRPRAAPQFCCLPSSQTLDALIHGRRGMQQLHSLRFQQSNT